MIRIDKKLVGRIARQESLSSAEITKGILAGTIVVPSNAKRRLDRPCGIGKGLSTKVNANIGLSTGQSSVNNEVNKLRMALSVGADTVMDLSTGPLVKKVRRKILSACPVPLGTVPVYDLACDPGRDFMSIKEDEFLDVVRAQAEEGVDFFTIHCGLTYAAALKIKRNRPRIMNIVSRGGALLAAWMIKNKRENPYLSRYDDILDILRKFNITLSLGDSLRPGAISDAGDDLQIGELLTLGDLQQKAISRGVQVIIEGPGHVPLDQIESQVKMQKTICHNAPFYVLGPLVTDSAPGYDHITGAIGGALAAWHGADYLCYVTPAEHVRLPNVDDVKNGVMASKIAAHAADIVKGRPAALRRDNAMSVARSKRDWKRQFELALDPGTPREMRKTSMPRNKDVCTMCADLCSIKVTEKMLSEKD